ncbi:MAG: phosphatase PAP2 family protein [Solirubrobacteraceae bacterium]
MSITGVREVRSKRGLRPYLVEADRIDRAVYASVARTSTPRIDGLMRHLSSAANYSRLSIACAALLATAGGPTGRRAAASGLTSVAVTSAFVNVALKNVGRRRRPDPRPGLIPTARRIAMPKSPAFPSGHAASAMAFAVGAGRVSPAASVPLQVLAALVGYSRVHTGVHYPSDVVVGALTGATIADLTAGAVSQLSDAPRQSHDHKPPPEAAVDD